MGQTTIIIFSCLYLHLLSVFHSGYCANEITTNILKFYNINKVLSNEKNETSDASVGCSEDRRPCHNFGTCWQSKCYCQPGTIGPWCGDVDCGDMCGTDAKCSFDAVAKRSDCVCDNRDQRFNDEEKKCENCDCGEGQLSCEWSKQGKKKICQCKDGYVFNTRSKSGSCFSCSGYCNANAKSCVISEKGVVSCICKEGFQIDPTNFNCQPCDCGSHGNCNFSYSSLATCTCEDGYAQNSDRKCQSCSCGEFGSCWFDMYNKKRCNCVKRYNYNPLSTKCEKCFCGYESECYYESNGTKTCGCKAKKFAHNGICKDCDCGLDVDCTFEEGIKNCSCTIGYESVNGTCVDIDECIKPDACPATKDCINTIGSYECFCKVGYKEASFETEECVDIDECKEFKNCVDSSTVCVNTIGSYMCKYKAGYRVLAEYPEPRFNICYKDLTSMIISSIVGSVGLLVVIILTVVWYLRRRRHRR